MDESIAEVVARWRVVPTESLDGWLAAREGFLTASDAAAVLGVHPFKSRGRVLREKRERYDRGFRPDAMAMRAGQYLEAPVFRWWLDDQGALWRGGMCRDYSGSSLLVRHADDFVLLAASPDAVAVDPLERTHLVEVKVHGPKQWAAWVEPPTGVRLERCLSLDVPESVLGAVPVHHWVQVQAQLLCTGESLGWVVGNCGSERREFKVIADAGFWAKLESATVEFWAEVAAGGSDG